MEEDWFKVIYYHRTVSFAEEQFQCFTNLLLEISLSSTFRICFYSLFNSSPRTGNMIYSFKYTK